MPSYLFLPKPAMFFSGILLLILLLAGPTTFSQQSHLKNRWSFKMGFSKYEEYQNKRKLQVITGADYGITPYLELGGYVGYARYNWTGFPRAALFSGIVSNFHLIPFLLKEGNPRIDLYVGQRIGGLHLQNPTGSFANEPDYHIDMGVHAGITYYLKRRWGLFLEKGYANGYGVDNIALDYYRNYFRFGISIKN